MADAPVSNGEPLQPGEVSGTISVVLADDQALMRMGFRMVLEAEEDIAVVGEASDGTSALAQAKALHPDVILMDVRMPGMNGIEATERIARECPGTRVLILTTFDLDEYAFAGLRAGASGFLLKDTRPTELAEAIGLPEGRLEQTVEEWNTMVDAGVDYAFHRNPDTFVKIEEGPFYGVRIKPAFLNTDGGPKRSAKAEVIDVDGEAIPGLYSAGEFGSVTGACYQGGQNISESGVFGRIAAHSAFGVA